ncbi:hypothetical protein [Thermofilum pendens]|uniref:Uncharacterized protein n=1 Tax=Thermofilum pendens (strain DSM 2475 / Hrk 5) TaxID=368408 RepID=A1S1D1_THEPD|nr:hypothetical protein [Thermofilum pendens]ABL79261.1 hypothetical protein Tpen_1866 [Thermofilum pendens Hrk 5]
MGMKRYIPLLLLLVTVALGIATVKAAPVTTYTVFVNYTMYTGTAPAAGSTYWFNFTITPSLDVVIVTVEDLGGASQRTVYVDNVAVTLPYKLKAGETHRVAVKVYFPSALTVAWFGKTILAYNRTEDVNLQVKYVGYGFDSVSYGSYVGSVDNVATLTVKLDTPYTMGVTHTFSSVSTVVWLRFHPAMPIKGYTGTAYYTTTFNAYTIGSQPAGTDSYTISNNPVTVTVDCPPPVGLYELVWYVSWGGLTEKMLGAPGTPTPNKNYARLVGATFTWKFTPNATYFPTTKVDEYLLVNGSKASSLALSKKGLYNATFVNIGKMNTTFYGVLAYLPPVVRAGTMYVYAAELKVNVLSQVGTVGAPSPGFTLSLAGANAPGYFALQVKVPEGVVTVEKAEGVAWNRTVLPGIAKDVKTSLDADKLVYTVNYTYTLYYAPIVGGVNFLGAWGIEETPSLTPTSPTIATLTASKPVVLNATRNVIRVLDSAGNDVSFVGKAIAIKSSGTYTVKLETVIKVVNLYQGKKIPATVRLYDAKGLRLAEKTGEEVTFTVEPGLLYTVESDNGNEVLTQRVTPTQDVDVTMEFTKPPAVVIPWEWVWLALAIVFLVVLIYFAKRLKEGLEIVVG